MFTPLRIIMLIRCHWVIDYYNLLIKHRRLKNVKNYVCKIGRNSTIKDYW